MAGFHRTAILALGLVMAGHSATGNAIELDSSTTIEIPKGKFRAADDPRNLTDEKIRGEPNFQKVKELPKNDPNYVLSKKVGQLIAMVEDKGVAAICSGTLVGHDLFLTNHHCVTGHIAEQADGFGVVMENLNGLNNAPKESFARVRSVVESDQYLDFALLQIQPPLGLEYGWVPVARNTAQIKAAEAVKIIQHPDGRSKEIVTEDTKVARHVGKFMHYLADTEGGSSGAPVFALDGKVMIGLHHAGRKDFNEAARADVIANMLSNYLPKSETSPETTTSGAGDGASSANEATGSLDKSGGRESNGDGMQAITE